MSLQSSVDDYQSDDIDIAIDEFKEEEEDEDVLNEPKTEKEYKCEPCDETFAKESWLVRRLFPNPELKKEEYSCFHCKNVYG